MRDRILKACAPALILATGVLVLTQPCGCVGLGYRLGSSLPPDIRSVYVPVFVNRTGEPRVETEATRAAKQEFQRDGTLHLA